MEKEFIIITFFLFHFVSNFIFTKILINKLKYIQTCFFNYIICSLILLVLFLFSFFSLNEILILFYFVSILSLVYLQFYYGFVTGMSSDLVYPLCFVLLGIFIIKVINNIFLLNDTNDIDTKL